MEWRCHPENTDFYINENVDLKNECDDLGVLQKNFSLKFLMICTVPTWENQNNAGIS